MALDVSSHPSLFVNGLPEDLIKIRLIFRGFGHEQLNEHGWFAGNNGTFSLLEQVGDQGRTTF